MNIGPSQSKPLTPTLTRDAEDGSVRLLAPALGLWRGQPAPGTPLVPGMPLGAIEVLGVLRPLVVPEGARGLVRTPPPERRGLARRPVEYGEVLLVLDPGAVGLSPGADGGEGDVSTGTSTNRHAVKAPTSGRFYRRPSPDKPAFVSVGDQIDGGLTIGLLEVMKTFNRIQYDGNTLPVPARVVAIYPADGDDVSAGDVLLEVEPIE